MSASSIRVAPDSTGKRLQTVENTIEGEDVHAEAVFLVGQDGLPLAKTDSDARESTSAGIPVMGVLENGQFTFLSAESVTTIDGPQSHLIVDSYSDDGAIVTLGEKNEDPASSDIGTFSLIALFKRLLQGITTISGNTSPKGAANLLPSRGTSADTESLIAPDRSTRRGILIRNLDATLFFYVGPTGVSVSTGFPIGPGEACPFSWLGAIYVISDSGTTPAWAIADEYD